MRRLVVLVSMVVAAVVAGALVAAVATGVRRPELTLVSRMPLEVRGTGFRPREGVTVTAGGSRVRLRSSSIGGFEARFGAGDRCSVGRVVAVGSSGDRVTLRLPPALCPPASPDGPAA
jgi:hypothetical protein